VLPIAQALVVEMGAEPVVIEERDRVLYHCALAHASNHLVTITAQSAQLLQDIGVEQPDRLLGPLMRASLENALAAGEGVLTGPVARGDVGTLQAHRGALAAHEADGGPADIRAAYQAMARATAMRALSRGLLNEAQAAAIIQALSNPTEGPDQ
jgi:predicted short-subunit dehydrogenase-like oxidoreductase (DUF2520 family)